MQDSRRTMSRRDAFDRILASLHDATFDDAHWPHTAALIDDACGAAANGLVVGEGFADDARVYFARFYFRGQRREDVEHEYFEVYHPRDERLPRLRQLPDSQVVHVTRLYSEAERKTSPVYNEGLPRIASQNGLNVRLDGPDGLRIVWAFADPVEPAGWGTAQTRMIERLVPHIRHFVCVRQVVAGADALGASLTQMLDNTRVGVIHLDLSGRVVEANDRAHCLLRRGNGLQDQGGFLCAWLPADDARFKQLLAGALPTFSNEAATGGSMTVRRASGLPPLVVHVNPVSVRQMDFGGRRVAALVLVVDPGDRPRIDPRLVAEVLGLTPAESAVAVLLSQGKTVRDIATERNCQEKAVHWHLQQIYKKRGMSRQTDLVRQVLSLSALSGSGR